MSGPSQTHEFPYNGAARGGVSWKTNPAIVIIVEEFAVALTMLSVVGAAAIPAPPLPPRESSLPTYRRKPDHEAFFSHGFVPRRRLVCVNHFDVLLCRRFSA